MKRETKRNKGKWGRTISVQFEAKDDRIVRDTAHEDGRTLAAFLRMVALAEVKRRRAEVAA